ncbi:MAG: hypothetical protein IJA48_02055 [Oscillospiraceae bacterium]|nr:hypothetical protein [Oscillospiraceae bacterium]
MKKKLLWIVPAVLAFLILVGLGIYLDHSRGQQPLPEVTLPEPGTHDPTEPDVQDPSREEPPPESLSTEPIPTQSAPPETTLPPDSSQEATEPDQSQPKPTEPVPTEPVPTEPVVTEPQPTEPDASTEPDAPTEDPELAAKEARIEELVAEVYALRDHYTAQLLALEASAIAEYEALPPEERTPERKQAIAFSCIDAAYALEDACDARMDAICQELSYLLLETGGSMSLITDIRYAYASEKESTRTAFLEKYADYFG